MKRQRAIHKQAMGIEPETNMPPKTSFRKIPSTAPLL
jgi:hypothetical protein